MKKYPLAAYECEQVIDVGTNYADYIFCTDDQFYRIPTELTINHSSHSKELLGNETEIKFLKSLGIKISNTNDYILIIRPPSFNIHDIGYQRRILKKSLGYDLSNVSNKIISKIFEAYLEIEKICKVENVHQRLTFKVD